MMAEKCIYKVWNKSVQFEVDRVEYPASLQELSHLAEEALNQGYALKAIGIGHSNTEIAAPKDQKTVYVSLKNMNRVKSCTADEITVEGGMTLHELCTYLKSVNKEPYCVLEYGFFHIGAICGTHAHDTSSNGDSALFASHVTGLKMISYERDPEGKFQIVLQAFRESTHPHEMRFLRSHFGLCGIVYEVTLRIKPARMLAIQYRTERIDCFLDHVETIFYEGYEVQCFITVIPNTGDVIIEARERLAEHPKSQKKSLKGLIFFFGRLKAFFHVEKLASTIRPRFVQNMIAYAARKVFVFVLPMATKRPLVVHPCDRAIVYDGLPTFDYVEWAYPTKQIRSVVAELLQLQRKHGLGNLFNLYLERENDDAVLSRTYDGDKISIDIVNSAMDETWYRFVEEWNQISIEHDGIPHFNKTPQLLEVIRQNGLSKFYPVQRLSDYSRFRASVDPADVFNNCFGECFPAGEE